MYHLRSATTFFVLRIFLTINVSIAQFFPRWQFAQPLRPARLPSIVPPKLCCEHGLRPHVDPMSGIRMCSNQADCPQNHDCNTITFVGMSYSVCCASRGYTCTLSPIYGYQQCMNYPRLLYYFDVAAKKCQQFQHTGCGPIAGNAFDTSEDCHKYCSSSACSEGESIIVDRLSGKAQQCILDDKESSACPQGYLCKYNRLNNQYVCCGNGAAMQTTAAILPVRTFSTATPTLGPATTRLGPITPPPVQNSSTSSAAPTTTTIHYFQTVTQTQTPPFGAETQTPPVPTEYKGTGKNITFNFDPATAQCAIGKPLKNADRQIVRCNNQCPENFACSYEGFCCPLKINQCTMDMDMGIECGKAISKRWYFDSFTGTCLNFDYMGCYGNSNNFVSEEVCLEDCKNKNSVRARPAKPGPTTGSPAAGPALQTVPPVINNKPESKRDKESKCPKGRPARNENGTPLKCSNTEMCPMDYDCTNGICCLKAQTLCNFPSQKGNCRAKLIRYSYNPQSSECEKFSFSGCGGNENNFAQQQQCAEFCKNQKTIPQCIHGSAYRDTKTGKYQTCSPMDEESCPENYACYYDGFSFGCCPLPGHVCHQNAHNGKVCGVKQTRFFYSTAKKSCEQFQYSGCDGNDNNFVSKISCERYCSSSSTEVCIDGGMPLLDYSKKDFFACLPSTPCPTDYSCVTREENFELRGYCCLNKVAICKLSVAEGERCSALPKTKWFFDTKSQKCKNFAYNGCQGNANNFETESQCINYCAASVCSSGEVPRINPTSQLPHLCTDDASCGENNYRCVVNALGMKSIPSVCCGADNFGVCESGETAFVNLYTQSVKRCQPDELYSCPERYACNYSEQIGDYYCCSINV